jgi:hypothetical protein
MLVDEFKRFMIEREMIRFRKENSEAWPWTKDPILQKYKFTNVHRSDDRTSREFLKIYRAHDQMSHEKLLYACGVCRYFGAVEFISSLPIQVLFEHNPEILIDYAFQRRAQGLKVFTSAYVITNGGRSEPKENVVAEYLGGLWNARLLIMQALYNFQRWQHAYEVLSTLPGFGGKGFMAKEVLQDFLMHHTQLPIVDRDTWTPMGPGARRGINRVLGRSVYFVEPERLFIKDCQELREKVIVGWPWKRTLTAHDIQFQLCEFDKYMRVKTGEGKPKSLYFPYRAAAAS